MHPFHRILHPVDLEHHSLTAFCHALKLALSAASHSDRQGHALLELFHCQGEGPAFTGPFPQVRQRLERWGVLPEGSEKQAVVDLGLAVRKQVGFGQVEEEIALEVEARKFDLLVMSSLARAGWSYFLHSSISARSVQNTQVPGLLFPRAVNGFVQPNTGKLDLRKILVPVAPTPDAWPALQAVARLLLTLQPGEGGEVMLIYAGHEQDFPEHGLPPLPANWLWTRKTLAGDPVAVLSAWAREWQPDLVGLASAGQKSWRDRWFGSTAEQLFTELHCPMLVAPSEGE